MDSSGGFSNKTQQSVNEALESALSGTQFRRMAICITENSPDVAVPVLQKEGVKNDLSEAVAHCRVCSCHGIARPAAAAEFLVKVETGSGFQRSA